MMTQQEVLAEIYGLDIKGIFSFEALTPVKALKKSRLTKVATPANVEQAQKFIMTTVSLGNNYEAAVNNRLVKEGKEADFQADRTYCLPVNSSLILYKHKDREQFYLRVYPNLCHAFKYEVYVIDGDGRRHSPSEFQDLYAEFLPPKREEEDEEMSHQGLANPVMVRNYKVENIIRLKRGEFEINVKGL